MAAPNRGLVGVEVDSSKILAKLAPSLYRRAVADAIAGAATVAERTAKGAAPKDMGALRRSITHEIHPLSARVYSTLAYAQAVEEGRRPGARPPPPEVLLGWMARHGMDGVSPYVLARAIGRRGTKGRWFMRAGVQAANAALPRLLGLAARAIQREWAK